GYLCVRALRWLYFMIRPHVLSPRSFTPVQWTTRMCSLSAARQADLIARTDHQSLGLMPDEFLEVLNRLAPHISEEPALSVYWQHRAELEQILKQERNG